MVEDTSVVLAEVAEAGEIVAEAVEATSAGLVGGVALGVLGAAALIGLTKQALRLSC